MKNKNYLRLANAMLFLSLFGAAAFGQTTEFKFKGTLVNADVPPDGTYDFEFRLFNAESGGAQLGTQQRLGVTVTSWNYSVRLDFGNAFPGALRFLEIAYRTEPGPFITLSQREPFLSVPYAIRSLNAGHADSADSAATATNSQQLGGVAANQFVQNADPRLSDARNPLPGSGNYIQNRTTSQPNSNFYVSGTGTLGGTLLTFGTISTFAHYSIANNRVLGAEGDNLFAGWGSGANNTGTKNSFFGRNAGNGNTSGTYNSFFGTDAGISNTTGQTNSFFGVDAGRQNTEGFANSFFGVGAGGENTQGTANSFFGNFAGSQNKTGSQNSFFGTAAGNSNTTGSQNVFVGYDAGTTSSTGHSNSYVGHRAGNSATPTTGSNNAFFGQGAGFTNRTGSNNTLLGTGADVGVNNLDFATAIGAGAVVSAKNTIQLGRSNGDDFVLIPGRLELPNLASAGSTQLCRNSNNRVGTCSSSLRYKTNIGRFNSGLSLVNQLKPITFNWIDGGMADLGLGAEDVAAIEPLLVTYNKDGQVEGVKYDRIGVVLLNAVKEQQAQILRQQGQIDILKKLVCLSHPNAEACK